MANRRRPRALYHSEFPREGVGIGCPHTWGRDGHCFGRSSSHGRRDATAGEVALFWAGVALCIGLSWWVLL